MSGECTTAYVCIHCGSSAEQMYRDYEAGITKICHCSICNRIVDKYVEYDPVIVFLDCLLLKMQAFRHVLRNTDVKNAWKLTFLFLLCDAYYQLQQRLSRPVFPTNHLLYSALEWDLYVMFFIVICELSICTGIIIVALKLDTTRSPLVSSQRVLRALLLSNYGKLFVIPALLWGQPYSHVYLWLIRIFVLLSNVQALRAYGHSRLTSGVAVFSGHLCQRFASVHLHSLSCDL